MMSQGGIGRQIWLVVPDPADVYSYELKSAAIEHSELSLRICNRSRGQA